MFYKRKDEIYNSYDYIENTAHYNFETTEYTGAALGISVGGKWVTKKGFVAEISLGIGRVMKFPWLEEEELQLVKDFKSS
jgi:hypothetical protein